MSTRFISFGFKYGTPVDADVVLDVRFLDNPNFVPELRELTGMDRPVVDYVMGMEETTQFLLRARELLAFTLPRYQREGKAYLTVAVGCTGGRHRSVVLAERLARDLAVTTGLPIAVVHRDVGRGSGQPDSDVIGGGPRGGAGTP
jgi:UPF0042 nucleotide-binding protein